MKISTPLALAIIALTLLIVGVVGYQRYQSELIGSEPVGTIGYPPFYTEEGWTVQQVGQFISDLAALGRSTEPRAVQSKILPVKSGEPSSYQLTEGRHKEKVSLATGVWNPASYAQWAQLVLGKSPKQDGTPENFQVADALLTPGFDNFLELNKTISERLQANPYSAQAHVEAALLLGTIGLNDYAGCFRDTRPVLNRMVAHLAVADALGAKLDQPNRRLAEAIRLTLCGQQADALKVIDQMAAGIGPNQAWTTVLRLRNTDDWRDKSEVATEPKAARYEYFRTVAHVASVDKGRAFLEKFDKNSPGLEYCRIAAETSLSVENGHRFISPWFKQELAMASKAAKAFQVSEGKSQVDVLTDYLDSPAGSPVLMREGKPVIQVAGQNLFASFHQRHLMECLNRTYGFLHDQWGVHDQAKELKSFVQNQLPPLRYKPFLLRLIARTQEERQETNKACAAMIEGQTPLVTPAMWFCLNADEDGKRLSLQVPDFHPWFRPEVPAGTAYEVNTRMYDIGVGDENDAHWLEELRQRAPYANSVARQLVYVGNGGTLQNAPADLILEYTTPIVEYEYRPMKLLTQSYKSQPKLYEKWMLKLAELDSDAYLMLAQYFAERKMDEDAAKYYLIAFEKTEDRVYVANQAQWIVAYLYKKGEVAIATKIAEDAAEVYSGKGLDTYIWLMEQQGKWDQALETARKIDERYNEGKPSAELACLIRQRQAAPQLAESPRYKEVVQKIFPKDCNESIWPRFPQHRRQAC